MITDMDMHHNRKWKSAAEAAGFLVMITLNVLANALPLNGVTTGELSDKYPNLFVPAGIAFSIWGVIYLLLACFVAFNLVQGWRHDPGESQTEAWPWFFISCMANAGWIVAWHNEWLAGSMLIMLLLLASLIVLYYRIRKGSRPVPMKTRWFVRIPISVYLGWITVATVANATALLVSLKWNGFGLSEATWAIVMMLASCVIGWLALLRRNDFAFVMVLVWALLGIWIKRHQDVSPGSESVERMALALFGGMIAMLVLRTIQLRNERTSPEEADTP